MAKRVKTVRQPRSTFWDRGTDPLAKPKPLGGDAQAALWLRWSCARDGVEFPSGGVEITFYDEGRGHGMAYVYSTSTRSSYWHSKTERGELVMTRAVPAWAMPCKRADLFIAARQTGKSLSDCLMFGREHWQNADNAAMDGETWDTMKAHEMLDYQARHRREDGDCVWQIEHEAAELDAGEEIRAYQMENKLAA
jgi:hypothetical protein